jgi:microcystin degradation protein MlrC
MKQCVAAQLPLSHIEQNLPALMDVLFKYQNSTHTDLQQTAYEFVELLKSNPQMTAAVLPVG